LQWLKATVRKVQQAGLQDMRKIFLATVVAMVGSSVALVGQSRDSRYDNPGDGRNDTRYDDRTNGGRNNNDYGVSVQVHRAPPPPPSPAYRSYRPANPGRNFIWVDGFWNWRGNRYAWTTGYWAPRPHMSAFWVAPRYDRGRYYNGYWGGRNDRYRGQGYRR